MNKLNEYKKYVIKLCETPKLSIVIQEKLMDKYKISKEYSKEIISLSVKDEYIYPSVYNGNKLLFDSGSLAYSSKKGNYQFLELLPKYKPYLNKIITIMNSNNSIISYLEIAKISGCVNNDNNKHKSFKNVLNELRFFYNIDTFIYDDQYFIINKNEFNFNETQMGKLETTESNKCKLLYSILRFLEKSNIIDGKPLYRSEKKPFNGIINSNHYFDALSFTNIKDIDKQTKSMVLIDYVIDYEYDEVIFEGFKRRVGELIFSTKGKGRKILAIIVCKDMSKSVEREAKRLGYIVLRLESLFGNRIFDLIKILNQNNIGKDIDKIYQALDIVNQNINLGNLKGELFERLCCDIIRKLFDRDNIIFQSNVLIQGIEVDLLISGSNYNIFFEFKSMKREMKIGKRDTKTGVIEENTFKKAFNNFNTTKEFNKYKDMENYLCIISANGFSKEVKEKAANQSKYKHADIPMLIDKQELINQCKRSKNAKILKHDIEALEQFF